MRAHTRTRISSSFYFTAYNENAQCSLRRDRYKNRCARITLNMYLARQRRTKKRRKPPAVTNSAFKGAIIQREENLGSQTARYPYCSQLRARDIRQENKKTLQNLISGAQSNGTITLLLTEYCRYDNRLLAFSPFSVFLLHIFC